MSLLISFQGTAMLRFPIHPFGKKDRIMISTVEKSRDTFVAARSVIVVRRKTLKAFQAEPQDPWKVGLESTTDQLSPEELVSWFRQGYSPSDINKTKPSRLTFE